MNLMYVVHNVMIIEGMSLTEIILVQGVSVRVAEFMHNYQAAK